MLKQYSCFILLISLFSCKPETDQKTSEKVEKESIKLSSQNISGNLFFFAPEFDKETCYPEAGCDCCTDHILFLDDSNFITVSYCESDQQIFKGKYKINGDVLALQYDTIQFDKEYNWKKQIDTTDKNLPEYFITAGRRDPFKLNLKASFCKQNIYLKGEGAYGSIDPHLKPNEFIQSLKQDGILEKLK